MERSTVFIRHCRCQCFGEQPDWTFFHLSTSTYRTSSANIRSIIIKNTINITKNFCSSTQQESRKMRQIRLEIIEILSQMLKKKFQISEKILFKPTEFQQENNWYCKNFKPTSNIFSEVIISKELGEDEFMTNELLKAHLPKFIFTLVNK